MTDAKKSEPAMPDTSKADTDKPRGNGAVDGLIPRDKRGAGGGGPIGPDERDGPDFHGGQSNAAYHGYGQLGEDDVEGQENANAPSEDA